MNELINVQIETKDGINVVSSRVIAKELGKEHKSLLRDCRNVLEEGVEFVPSEYITLQNKTATEYLLTKDGFILLIMNYQGHNEFKRAYINRFNEMEKAIQEQQKPQLPETYLDALKQLVASEEERLQQAKLLEEQKPLVEFAKQVSDSNDCIDIGQFSKLIKDENIKMGRNKLFAWLRDSGYLMTNNTPYQRYIDNGYFTVVELIKKIGNEDKIILKTLITGKGQQKILEKIKNLQK